MTDFSLRIFITDHYLTKPLEKVDYIYNDFTKKSISQVPIIKMFGCTPKGQKVCAHIHGVYPYFYVPFFGDHSIALDKDRLDELLLGFASSLSSAISISFNNNIKTDQTHVFRVILVKGKPFYGYTEHIQYFLKIYLYNPNLIKKAGELLQSGAVMNISMQPYEIHLPYNLKFFIDYNLYGMNYLYTDAAMFRVNKEYHPEGSFIDLDISDSLDISQKTWNVDQLPLDCIMDERICPKESWCELEVDICACDILNIHEVEKNIGNNPGLKDLWEEEKQRRIDLGLDLSELVGEVFEDRPMTISTESEVRLLGEWKEVCCSVKEVTTTSQDVDAFICGSPLIENVCEDINEEYIQQDCNKWNADSFITCNVSCDIDFDEDMTEFINACMRKEEEDSIIQDKESECASTLSMEMITKKCSFTQLVSTQRGFVKDASDSDEDLFDKTIIDLSLDDEDDLVNISSKQTKKRGSSSDLFEDDSEIIDLSSDNSDVEIIMTYDGADDEEMNMNTVSVINRTSKIDNNKVIRSPISTRSKPQLNNDQHHTNLSDILSGNRKRKKSQIRKPRLSLKLKKDFPISDQSILKYTNVILQEKSTNESTDKRVRTESFEDVLPSINEDISLGVSLSNVNNSEIHKIRKTIKSHKKLSLKLKEPFNIQNNLSFTSNSLEIDDTTNTLNSSKCSPQKNSSSVKPTYSTPCRSNMVSFHKIISDISPIMKSSKVRDRNINSRPCFIPEISQENTHFSPQKLITVPNTSDINEKLSTLEFMKKSLSQSLHEASVSKDFMTNKYHASMTSHLTLMSAEIHCHSSSNLKPNPTIDPILMFFYSIHYETDVLNNVHSFQPIYEEGIIYIDEGSNLLSNTGITYNPSYRTIAVSLESELLNEIVKLVLKYDPDILVGYETSRASWGYILERSFNINHDLYLSIGRFIQNDKKRYQNKVKINEEFVLEELHCSGRIIMDLWVLMKYELTLNSYTLENVMDDVLKERIPLFTNQQLMVWYRLDLQRHRVIQYWKFRATANLRLLGKLGCINRISEFAKIYGIEFYHVLSRGSQYRVEAMMLRLAKPQNLIAISPNVQQRSQQKAPECIPLVLEPNSGFYRDPVVVLDFQSLYPSIMIAYNYCFSTSLGNLDHIKSVKIGDSFEFGCNKLFLEKETINKLGENVNISPNKVVFVKPEAYKGIISKMVEEILTTRIMVKKSMKIHKENKALCKQLDSRQLGLKLIANVTYGYTAASYSGRMPCVEVGDSIVRKARDTLEEAIRLVNSGGPDGYPKSDDEGGWQGCSVIYGDTDSMFVHMPGRTKDEAFILGNRIADIITSLNPFPVKLKFEKVYLPCLLEAKKRYVGYSYESSDQTDPKFDAKGIETVRRDNCNIVSKILERTLIRLFTTDNMDNIKRYVTGELDKLLSGKVNMTDFIIAKEYRGRKGYRPGASIPALHIANELRKTDVRAEPLAGERVPYVIIQGAPGDTLLSCVRQPCDLLFNTKLLKSYGNNIRSLSEQGCKISYIYYITKQILPPLNRALSHLGVDVFKWYSQMPKCSNSSGGYRGRPATSNNLNRTISSYFLSQKCILCDNVIKGSTAGSSDNMTTVLCDKCLKRGAGYIYYCGTQQLKDIEDVRINFQKQCYTCTNSTFELKGVGPACVSIDCPTLFDRIRAFQEPKEDLEILLQSNIY